VTGYGTTGYIDDMGTAHMVQELTIAQYNSNGTPDATFGADGVALPMTDTNATGTGYAVMTLSGGTIVVAGVVTASGNESVVVGQYSTTGMAASTYTYDVRNKMIGFSSTTGTATYMYDDNGNRVQETTGGTTSFYLTDTANPTGYAQPIEVWTATGTVASIATATLQETYVIGDRVFGQANAGGTLSYFLTDGHGSTRLITNSVGAVTVVLNYDSFGDALNFNAADPPTIFLFGGDAVFDPISLLYFHGDGVRDAEGFLFIQMDTYAGNKQDPISLHKYLYADADSPNADDPTGLFTYQFGNAAHAVIGALYQDEYPNAIVNPTRGIWGALKPDIFDVTRFVYAEIKPFTSYGVISGFAQMAAYDRAYGQTLNYTRDTSWPDGGLNFTVVNGVQLFFFNVQGIIFYTDFTDDAEEIDETVTDRNSALEEVSSLNDDSDAEEDEIEQEEIEDVEGEADDEAGDVGASDEADIDDDLGEAGLDGLEGGI
jgi:YD repeat-containing protein